MSDTNKRFGFAQRRLPGEIPTAPEMPAEKDRTIDKAAEKLGFHSREPSPPSKPSTSDLPAANPYQPLRRNEPNPIDGPLHQISVRGPMVKINRFIRYCKENDLPYWRAIDKFLDDNDFPE